MNRPLRIAVEGIDGAGKTSLCASVARALEGRGLAVKRDRLGKHSMLALKAHIDAAEGREGEYQVVISRSLRAQILAVESFVRLQTPEVETGLDVVVFDRWFQMPSISIGEDVLIDYLTDPTTILRSLIPQPDVVIWLDVSEEIALERLIKSGDWMVEVLGRDGLLAHLRDSRTALQLKYSNVAWARRIAANLSPHDVSQAAVKALIPFLPDAKTHVVPLR